MRCFSAYKIFFPSCPRPAGFPWAWHCHFVMQYLIRFVSPLWFFILALLLPVLLVAQKEDYQWPLGSAPGCNTCLYRFFYNFCTDPPSVVLRDDTISTSKFMATYSDSQGRPLLFSNGLQVYNALGQQLEGAYGLNPSIEETQDYRSYFIFKCGFFLAQPGDTNIVHLVHLDFDRHPLFPPEYNFFIGANLLVTTLDIKAQKALAVNQLLVSGILQSPAATRHANGRDWWILVTEAESNKHHRFLLSPKGFEGPFTQAVGAPPEPLTLENRNIIGSTFSPSGDLYIDLNSQSGFGVYDFDRCTGLLSNERRVDYLNTEYRFAGAGSGAEFSPDGRFLYVSTTHFISRFGAAFLPSSIGYLIQYDLTAPNLVFSGDTVNVIDPGRDLYDPKTSDQLLGTAYGPDGRLYITYLGGSYCTVQYPNRKGKAALFRYDNPDFKNNIYRGIPYLPNYRLGPLDGSPCDTLGLNNVPVANFRMDTPDSSDLQGKLFYDLSHHEPAWWRWDFGDGSGVSTDTSPAHTYALPGRYRVCLTVGNAYGTNTYCREVSIGTIAAGEPESGPERLAFAPNPAHGATALYFSNATGTAQGDLLLLDALGRPTLRAPLRGQRTDLDIKGLLPGVYFAQVLRPGRPALTGKLVITDSDVRGE